MVNVEHLNKKLKDFYGSQDDQANFRLVYTREQTEYRRGTFFDYNSEGTFLRCVTEVRLVPRYAYIKPYEYWVIERLYPLPANLEVHYPGKKWTYEPVFFYSKPDRTKLPATEDSVHAAIHISLFAERKNRDFAAEELAEYEKQVDIMHQFLTDECPSMATQLHFGEGIAVPRNYNGSDNRIVGTSENSGVQAGAESGVCANSGSGTE